MTTPLRPSTLIPRFLTAVVRPVVLATLALALSAVGTSGCKNEPEDDGRSEAQRKKAAVTDEKAKKGALTEKADPAADLKKQKQNLERIRANEKGAREDGNRVAAWAAAQDARSVEKLIEKDQALLTEKRK